MNRGEILQIASPTDMYRSPVSKFVASFLGNPPMVLLEGRATDGQFETTSGVRLPLPQRLTAMPAGTALSLGIRPEHFGAHGPHEVEGTVSFVEPQGRETLFDVTVGERVVLRSVQPVREDVSLGDRISWKLDSDRLLAFDASGQAI
jgi:inositol-phosphate transport system ATP-binding protein